MSARWLPALAFAATVAAGAASADTAGLSLENPAPGVYVHYGQLADITSDNDGDVANVGFVVGARCVAPNSRDRSPRTETALPTATAYGGTGGGLALNRKAQKTPVAATSDQITNADSLANMRRLSWNALRLRASER